MSSGTVPQRQPADGRFDLRLDAFLELKSRSGLLAMHREDRRSIEPVKNACVTDRDNKKYAYACPLEFHRNAIRRESLIVSDR